MSTGLAEPSAEELAARRQCAATGHQLAWAKSDPVMAREFLLCKRCGKYARHVSELDRRFTYDPETLEPTFTPLSQRETK